MRSHLGSRLLYRLCFKESGEIDDDDDDDDDDNDDDASSPLFLLLLLSDRRLLFVHPRTIGAVGRHVYDPGYLGRLSTQGAIIPIYEAWLGCHRDVAEL